MNDDPFFGETSRSFAEEWAAAGPKSSSLESKAEPLRKKYEIDNNIRRETGFDSTKYDKSLSETLANEDISENALISSLERRQSHVRTPSGELWISAADGERPLLGESLPFEKMYSQVLLDETESKSTFEFSAINNVAANLSSQSPTISRPKSMMNRSVTIAGGYLSANLGNVVASDEKSTNSAISADKQRKAAARKERIISLVNGGVRRDHVTVIQSTLTLSPNGQQLPPLVPRRHRRNASRAQVVLDSIHEKGCVLESNVSLASSDANQNDEKKAKYDQESTHGNVIQVSRPSSIHRKSVSISMTETDQLLAEALLDPEEKSVSDSNLDNHFDQEINNRSDEGEEATRVVDSCSNTINPNENTSVSHIQMDEESPLLSQTLDIKNQASFPDSYSGDTTPMSTADLKLPRLNASIYRKRRRNETMLQKVKRFASNCFHPFFLLHLIYQMFKGTYFFLASIPFIVSSLILFYGFGNPSFYFLPGDATLAWWLNFLGRQLITLELARLAQFFFVDILVLRMRGAVQILGPFVTLLCIQSRGWPFVVMTWGFLDLFLLHGDRDFQLHWLYFTNFRFYTQANSGRYILTSELYLRLLISLIISGIACSVKRSFVVVTFGRRTFATFKPRLESILREVILLSEIAELAEEADKVTATFTNSLVSTMIPPSKSRILGSDLNWTRERFFSVDRSMKIGVEVEEDELTENSEDTKEDASVKKALGDRIEESSNRSLRVKDLLDKWEEPLNKLDKSLDTSIRDILKFRRALTFIDDTNPFGEAFGLASTRDQVLMSTELVYNRLRKLCPEDSTIAYDIFDMLIDEDESKNITLAKKKLLKRMFRPDANNQISKLSFLQSCDSLYKNLRFFRASVGNASVIDRELEGMLNGIFFFFLVLVVLSIIRINPWPLLVSISTLLVSVSFAVGSSASKYIEGVILIAGRRPYDLGDRIYMIDSADAQSNAITSSWFIEDINLSFTTVRFAATNEVATVSNGAIAGLRIVNANRSPNAVVSFELPFHISVVDDTRKLESIRTALDQYARDFPNVWKCFMLCRVNVLHIELEQALLFFSFQHQSSWQDVGRILIDKADLLCFVYELGKKLGINYDELPARHLVYGAGVLHDGVARSSRRDMIFEDNVKSISNETPSAGNIEFKHNDQFLKSLQQTFR